MTEIQVLTLLATLLGLIATVLNLVAFFREKERSHVRAALTVLVLLGLGVAGLFHPQVRARWESPGRSVPVEATASPAPEVALQGSFTLDLQRNLLGGVDALMARFHFHNPLDRVVKVTSYEVSWWDGQGRCRHRFERVLPESLGVANGASLQQEVELDPEIRDCWVAYQDLEPQQRDRMQIVWTALDSSGRTYRFSSSNG